jgi:hypothetical protein
MPAIGVEFLLSPLCPRTERAYTSPSAVSRG